MSGGQITATTMIDLFIVTTTDDINNIMAITATAPAENVSTVSRS